MYIFFLTLSLFCRIIVNPERRRGGAPPDRRNRPDAHRPSPRRGTRPDGIRVHNGHETQAMKTRILFITAALALSALPAHGQSAADSLFAYATQDYVRAEIGGVRLEVAEAFGKQDTALATAIGEQNTAIATIHAELMRDNAAQTRWIIGVMIALAGLVLGINQGFFSRRQSARTKPAADPPAPLPLDAE